MADSIWFKPVDIKEMNERGKGTMVEHIGLIVTEVGPDWIKGTMPVDHRTIQPRGLLHGGANVVLAESLASLAGNYVVNPAEFYCVGLEINANHIRSATDGVVEGISRPLHLGRTTQVWQTEIRQGQKLMAVSRMTLSVLPVTKKTPR